MSDLPQSKQEIIDKIRDLTREVTLREINEILNTTIKHDERNKVITFLSMILTYTSEDQINVSFTAESSTGKSYIPLELAWYFSKTDIIEYSYVSPTAFFHEYGTFQPDPSDHTTMEEEKKRRIILIDLAQKILIFIDQPHDMLLQRLRPLLSHDRKELVVKITDRREKGGLRTKTVVIRGYPTVLFCTAKFSMEDQERTRLLLLSPETSQDKLTASILLKVQKDGDRQAFMKFMEENVQRKWLAQRVELISSQKIRNVTVPEELQRKIADTFLKWHEKHLIPRHQRDVGRLMALIKAHALLNLWSRQRIEDSIIVEQRDVDEGFNLYHEISEANELGLPPEVYSIYLELKDQFPEAGLTRKEFQRAYYERFRRTIGKKRLEEMINLLTSVGLFSEELDPHDGRVKRIQPTCQGGSSFKSEGSALPTGQGGYSFEGFSTAESTFNSDAKLNTPQGVGNKIEVTGTVSFNFEKLERLTLDFQDTCLICHKSGRMDWQITQHDGSWGFLCADCGLKVQKIYEGS